MPHDAGLIRIDEQTGLGVALATDGNGRYCLLDPYAGTQLALAEAYRNVAATGARPLAVTNCLNFGSPEDPAVMWQFTEAVRGLADGCLALGIPVTGGNVSFYNQTGDVAIHPTPVVGVLGVHDDVRPRLSSASPGRAPRAAARRSEAEFGGSLWARVVHGHLGGRPPAVDLDAERALAEVLVAGRGLLDAAHDLSDGGLAVALAESCLAGGHGAVVELPPDPFPVLFSESAARAVVAVRPGAEAEFTALCQDQGCRSRRSAGPAATAWRSPAASHRPRRAGRRAPRHPARPVRLKVLAPRSGRGHERDQLLRARGRRARCELGGGTA